MKKIKESKNPVIIIAILILIVVVFITMGFSAFNSTFDISNIGAVIRIQSDIRITSITTDSTENGGTTNTRDYNVNKIYANIDLPNSSSTVTFNVVIRNLGSTEMGILDITEIFKLNGSNTNNIKITNISGYDLNNPSMLCDDGDSTICTLISATTLQITIGYATNGYNSGNDTEYDVELDFDFEQAYTISYSGFTSTSGLPTVILNGETKVIEFLSTNGIPSSVSVSGATNDGYASPYLTLSNPTGNVTVTAISSGGGSGPPGGTVVVENQDGSTTTTTYDSNGYPAEAVTESTDSSGNTTTQEITYVNGTAVVTGYSIDTSNNTSSGSTGVEVPSDGIDTGVLAFDGNDFTVTLKAKFTFANCTAAICPIINVTKKDPTVNGVLIYEVRVATSGYGHDASGTNVSPPYNKYRFGKYANDSPQNSVDYNIISKVTSQSQYGRYGYNSSTNSVTLTIKLYYTSGVFTTEFYDSTDTLLAKPYNNATQTFSDTTGSEFNNITVTLGTFTSGTTTYPTHIFEILDFNVAKTLS